LFYIREPGFLSALFTVIPFFDVERQFSELSLKQYYELSPIPIVSGAVEYAAAIRRDFAQEDAFPSSFSLLDFNVFDPDSDGQDEIVTHWLSYAGGSGGTKWSAIIDFVGGGVKVSSGFPDFFNLEFSRALWAIVRYSGVLDNRLRDDDELYKLLPVLKEMGLSDEDQRMLVSPKLTGNQTNTILEHLHSNNQTKPDKFINLYDGSVLELYGRHTDDYSQFIKIDSRYFLAEAFYILDSSCHWCGHYWRLLSFIYKDGRWISDRVINGNRFEGDWLSKRQKYTLNDVFGSYPDQGLFGIAFSFLNPDWTQSSREGISDPMGIEMRLTSPVEKRIRKIHQQEAAGN
jgi:hypothetical protein